MSEYKGADGRLTGAYWEELGSRALSLREALKKNKIRLKPGQDFDLALSEAESRAAGQKHDGKPSDAEHPAQAPASTAVADETRTALEFSLQACHVIWSLSEVVSQCLDAGLDVSNHLLQLGMGTIDYGTPAQSGAKTIFFKDFETELFVAGTLAAKGVDVSFPERANDPRGDVKSGLLWLEVEHPNSPKGLARLMRKHNKALSEEGLWGCFVSAIEDAFEVANNVAFTTELEHQDWLQSKTMKIERHGLNLVHLGSRLPTLVCMIQTQTNFARVGGNHCFQRSGNAVLFDNRRAPDDVYQQAEQVAACFAPPSGPNTWTDVEERVKSSVAAVKAQPTPEDQGRISLIRLATSSWSGAVP